jgi:hypothetical protein
MPKLFPLKKFVFAVCGDFSDGTTMVGKMIKDFEKSKPEYRTPEECLYKFGVFTKNRYPVYFGRLKHTVLLCAGYGPEQMIAMLLNGKTYTIDQDIWASNIYGKIDSLHLLNLPRNADSRQATETVINTLKDYIGIFHKEDEAGGLFSVLKISLDNSWHWVRNDFSENDLDTECEAARDIYDKKVRIYYTSEKNKRLLMQYVREIRKKCH